MRKEFKFSKCLYIIVDKPCLSQKVGTIMISCLVL